MAQAPSPLGIDGVSILPTITGQGTQEIRDYLYFENNENGPHGRPGTKPQQIWHRWAIQDTRSRMKLIYWEGESGTSKEGQTGYELYDFSRDPRESTNLLADPEYVNYDEFVLLKEQLRQAAIEEGAGREENHG